MISGQQEVLIVGVGLKSGENPDPLPPPIFDTLKPVLGSGSGCNHGEQRDGMARALSWLDCCDLTDDVVLRTNAVYSNRSWMS